MFEIPESEINYVCVDEDVVKGTKATIYRTLQKESEEECENSVDDDAESFPKDATSSGWLLDYAILFGTLNTAMRGIGRDFRSLL